MKWRISILSCLMASFSNPLYAESPKFMNLRIGPLGLILGALSAGVDFAVAPNWTLGPQGQYWHLHLHDTDDSVTARDFRAYGYGVRANWFKNGNFTDGLYVAPSITYAAYKFEFGDGTSLQRSGLYAGALVGYGWFWESFNMMLGAGAVVPLQDDKLHRTDAAGENKDYSARVAGFDAEFSFGITF